jgi:hypothetical protein
MADSFHSANADSERVQAPRQWVVACQQAVDTGQPRKELAYAVFEGSTMFPSFADASAAIMELGLPMGWVAIEADRLIDTGEALPDLLEALRQAQRVINSMKQEAETAGVCGDEQMLQEACETISNEGLAADMAIRAAIAKATGAA